MKHINYFKKETGKHRSPMARRQQAWDWLRKMKKEHNYTKKQFVKELHHMGLVRPKKNGMISSPPEGINRHKVDKSVWVEVDFAWADEFMRQMRGQ